MTVDRLATAASAFQAALDEDEASKKNLADARKRRTAAMAGLAKAREPLAKAIVAEARKGTRQRDIVERTGRVYTRERIRQICRSAGVEPAE